MEIIDQLWISPLRSKLKFTLLPNYTLVNQCSFSVILFLLSGNESLFSTFINKICASGSVNHYNNCLHRLFIMASDNCCNYFSKNYDDVSTKYSKVNFSCHIPGDPLEYCLAKYTADLNDLNSGELNNQFTAIREDSSGNRVKDIIGSEVVVNLLPISSISACAECMIFDGEFDDPVINEINITFYQCDSWGVNAIELSETVSLSPLNSACVFKIVNTNECDISVRAAIGLEVLPIANTGTDVSVHKNDTTSISIVDERARIIYEWKNELFCYTSRQVEKEGQVLLADNLEITDSLVEFSVAGDLTIVEWIHVEYRDKSENLKSTIQSRLSQSDLDIVGLDGRYLLHV